MTEKALYLWNICIHGEKSIKNHLSWRNNWDCKRSFMHDPQFKDDNAMFTTVRTLTFISSKMSKTTKKPQA